MPQGMASFFHLSSVFIKSLDKEAVAGARIQDIVLLGSAEKLDWQLTERDLKSAFRNINLAAMLIRLKYCSTARWERTCSRKLPMRY